ncbi:MAG: response regulator transcription factor [Micromonosporaceae bacterium]
MHVPLSLLDRSLKLVDALADVDDPADIPAVMLPALAELVPCDMLTYNEIGLSPARVRYVDYPAGILNHGDAAVFVRHLHEHPVINHYERTGDSRPAKISDFLDRQRFHSLGLYAEFYARIPVEHQMAVSLSAPGQWMVALAFSRARGDFTGLDRDLLNSLRGPLVAAIRRTGARHEAKATLNGTAATSAQLSQLTEREVRTLELVASGHTNVAIGHALNISPRTVAKHLEHIYAKLSVNNRAAAIARAAPIYGGQS